MKNFILKKLLGYVGGRLSGYKTYIAGGASIIYGLIGILGIMFPDQKLPQMDTNTAFGYISAGLAVIGVGHKIEKNTQAVESVKPKNLEGGS
jgi:hypothetical protein